MSDKPLQAPPPAAAAVDYEALGRNLARMMEEGGKALAAYMKPREHGLVAGDKSAEWTDLVKTFGRVFEYWLADPGRTARHGRWHR